MYVYVMCMYIYIYTCERVCVCVGGVCVCVCGCVLVCLYVLECVYIYIHTYYATLCFVVYYVNCYITVYVLCRICCISIHTMSMFFCSVGPVFLVSMYYTNVFRIFDCNMLSYIFSVSSIFYDLFVHGSKAVLGLPLLRLLLSEPQEL